MANFDNIIQEINTNIPDNTTQAITAAKMRTTLIDLTNQIDSNENNIETALQETNEIINNTNTNVDKLNSDVLGNPVGFEYGGIEDGNGALVNKTIRMRTLPLYVSKGIYKLNFNFPSSDFTTSVKWGYNGTTPVHSITIYDSNIFVADGTFDNIRLSVYKGDGNQEITQQEVDNSSISVEGLNELKDSVYKLNTSIYETVYGFEYGGIQGNGPLVNNTIRMRSLPIKVPFTGTSTTLKLYIVVPDGFVASFAGKYKGNTAIGGLTITDDSFVADGTFDNIRVSYKIGSAGTQEITQEQINASSVTIRTIETDIRELQDDIKEIMDEDVSGDIERLNNSIYDNNISFEYGGIQQGNGVLVNNTIRMRTLPLYLTNIEIGAENTYVLEIPEGFTANKPYAYNGTTPVRYLSTTVNNTVIADGTFDNIRLSVYKGDGNQEITQEEVDGSKIYFIGIQTKLNFVEDTVNKYKGLKYCALGDSITYGYIPRNYTGYPGQLNSYAKLTAQKLGMAFVNYGISGNQLAGNDSSMSVRYANMDDDADVITVMGGTNDIRNGVPLGQFSDRTNDTYYGGLHVLFQGLYTKYIGGVSPTTGKKVKIVALTPIKLLDRSKSSLPNTIENNANILQPNFELWVDAVKEVAAFYSIPVLDFYNLSGINPHLDRTVQGWQDGYTGLYNPYITDGTHPTQEGAEIMSNVLVGFLNSLK